jgi:hypothetical protein
MPKPIWFTADYDYSGYAEAAFADPEVRFSGPASVRPDENGWPIVEMTIEKASRTISSGFDLLEIEHGSESFPGGRSIGVGGGGKNDCTQLTVRGERGVFHSIPGWLYSFSNFVEGEPVVLRLNPMRSEYKVDGASPERFWALPLSNFVTNFPWAGPPSPDHPLAFWPEGGRDFASYIPFQLNSEPAFIWPLPGYAEAVKDLESGDRQVALTAVAVATFTNASMIDPWGPFLNTFLWLLYFATGKEIGAPWMELRDESGGLSRRLHLAGGGPKSYLDGYGAIRESDHWWNGEILTAALSSAEALEPFFSIALRHCFRAGRPGVTLDDQVGHLTRALDCLCSRYGFKQEDLTAGLEPGTREKIEDALRTASEEIRSLVGEAAGSGRSSQIPAIAARVLSAGQKDRRGSPG